MGELVYNDGFCGLEIDFHDDMDRLLAYHVDAKFVHFVFTPLVDPAYKPSLMEKGTDVSDLWPFAGHWFLNTREWSNRLVGKISSWIDLDSDDEMLRKDSEIALREEVNLASMLSLQACLLPTPKGSSCANYVRNVNQILQNLCSMQLLLRIPLVLDDDHGGEKLNYMGELQTDSLELWRYFHHRCEPELYNRLSVAFDFPCSLPSANSLQRWSDEPVRAAIINSKTFFDDRWYWVNACKAENHGKVMLWLFKHSIKMVLSGTPVPNVHPEILASSATNANNHDGDYRWHPLQIEMGYIISLHGFKDYLEDKNKLVPCYDAFSSDDDTGYNLCD